MSTVQNTTSTASTGTTTAAKPVSSETEDRFLKLLVAQMKNQDPLNPLDNAQVTSQMAQLSTVSGIEKLNASLQSMSTSFAASQSLQAAGMIGRGVLVPGSELSLNDGKAVGGYTLDQPADEVVISIKNAAGSLIHTENMGEQKTGDILFQWDGITDAGTNAPAGVYSFEVSALQGGKKVAVNPLAIGLVGSVSLNASGVMLNTDVMGSVEVSKVKQIF